MKYLKYLLFTGLVFQGVLKLNSQNVESLLGQWSGKIEKKKTWSVEVDFYIGDNGVQAAVSYPDYGLYNYIADSIELTDTSVNIFFNERNSQFQFRGSRKKNEISGEWKGLEQSALFSLSRKAKQYFPVREVQVNFRNEDAILSGTLILPEKKGPYPAVVQVHGSGNQTRSEDFYRSRAYLLARNGIAVLIYDRRGKGKSSGTNVTMDILAGDAISAVHYLQQNEWIDKNKIGIMGFSQGGYVAPLAASISKDIAFMVCGAAPSITPNEQNDFNVTNRLKKRNVSQDSINYVINLRSKTAKYQFFGEGNKIEIESEISALQKTNWFQQTLLPAPPVSRYEKPIVEFLNYKPMDTWQNVKIPTLLLWGQMDELVPAEKSRREIMNALNNAGNKHFETKVFRNAGHGLALLSNSEWDWPRLAKGSHELIVEWLKKITKKN